MLNKDTPYTPPNDSKKVGEDAVAMDKRTPKIQVCPKKGMSLTILFWGWDSDHQSYSREGSGFLG